MSYQGNQPVNGRFSKLDNISPQFNSSLTTFNLLVSGVAVSAITPQNLLISLNGVIQEPGTAYTTSNSTITFASAVPTGTVFFGILLGSVLSVGTPSDGTVDSSKLTTLNHIDMNTSTASVGAVSRIKWNDGDGTLDIGLKGGNVTLQVGQEHLARVYNASGQTLVDGKVVYVTGSQGNRPAISVADYSTGPTQSKTFGVVTEPIGIGAEGFITQIGLIRNFNTSAWAEGTELWLGAAGALTSTKPVAPLHSVFIGWVVRQHATVGAVYVNIQNGFSIDDMHDALLASKTNGDVLQYESSTGLWKNVQKGLGADTVMNQWLTKDIGSIKVDKGSIGTGTVTFDYTGGSCQRLQVIGTLSIAFQNWSPTGNLSVMQLEIVNGGSATVTWPTVNWIQKDGTFTTQISTYLTNVGRNALQTTGTDFFVFWTSNAGTTIYGRII